MSWIFPAANSKKAVYLKVYIYALFWNILISMLHIFSPTRYQASTVQTHKIGASDSVRKFKSQFKVNRQWFNSERILNWNYYKFVGSSSVEYGRLSSSLFCRSQEPSVDLSTVSNFHKVLSLSVVGLNLLRAFDAINHVILSYLVYTSLRKLLKGQKIARIRSAFVYT